MTAAKPAIDPLLEAALDRLGQMTPGWYDDDRDRWCALFVSMVAMLYPTKARRKSRAKAKVAP